MNTQDLMSPTSWAERTFGAVARNSRRRTRRAVKVACKLAGNPEESLPALMQSWKETKALYRLLAEPAVTFEALMQPHLQQSREEAAGSPVVLLVQDTTSLDLSHRQKREGDRTSQKRRRTRLFRANGAGRSACQPRGPGLHGSRAVCACSRPSRRRP